MLAVIDACRANDVGDLVYASSSEVYQTPPRVPTDEDVPLSIPDVRNPRYSYGGGKIASELIAMNHGRTGFDRVTIFRPHNVYGPDMGWEHVLPQFVLRAKELIAQHPDGVVPFPIQGDGSQTRAFIHIDDFTDGLIDVIDSIGLREDGQPGDWHYLLVDFVGIWTGGEPVAADDVTEAAFFPFEKAVSLTRWDKTRDVIGRSRDMLAAMSAPQSRA